MATQMGFVVNKVVEAAIEVKEREVIQVAKWMARHTPAANPYCIVPGLS